MADSYTSRLAKKFLHEITSKKQQEVFDTLIEVLESTIDPDPSELFLLDSLYQLQEKIKIVEARLSSYTINDKSNLNFGDKLNLLYSEAAPHGTSKLFGN
jgi:hypothetical protein